MLYVKFKKLIIFSLFILSVNLYGSNYTVLADATAKLIMDMKILKNGLNTDLNQSMRDMNLYIKNIDTNQTNNLNTLKNHLSGLIKHSNSRYRLKINTLQKNLTNKIEDIQSIVYDNNKSLQQMNKSLEHTTQNSKLLKKAMRLIKSKIDIIQTQLMTIDKKNDKNLGSTITQKDRLTLTKMLQELRESTQMQFNEILTSMHKDENKVEENRLKIEQIEELLQKKYKTHSYTKGEVKRLKILDERFDRVVQ